MNHLLEPGDRDKRVVIQYRRDGTSTTEFPVDDWARTRRLTVWMAKEDLRGAERLQAMQVQSAYDGRWVMGYRTDMDPDLLDVTKDRRLVYQGRVLNIVAGRTLGRKDGIELTTIANPSGETA